MTIQKTRKQTDKIGHYVITTNRYIIDDETIVSSGGTFELGFFNPSGSSNSYIGIWYKQTLPHVQTVVWVANREKPITNTSAVQLKNDNDPAPGEFTRNIDPTGYPQVLTKHGTGVSARIGPWNGLRWSGSPIPLLECCHFQLIFNEEEVYYTYSLINSSVLTRLVLTSNGYIQRLTWVDRTKRWHIYYNLPADNCDTHSLCGAYGSCDIDNTPTCGCLEKFVAKHPQQWEKGDWSEGCVRRTPLDCNKEHVFLKYSGIKLPDTKCSQYDWTMTLEECRQVCSRNCSCTAYSSLDINNGDKGCLFWFGELIDIRKLSERGQDIRMDSSEQGKNLFKKFPK
ncbi:hypothetical protein RND71_027753 [Anisodus tanguticus]|uniref:Apple domain-containing protein n=1 Tax=Anisodus tanguticus TaxID=243964 RepID=A0AAE1RH74_9SOLA|nr:hypothetical protein RND71_027753 [Anisodus tanguticus]